MNGITEQTVLIGINQLIDQGLVLKPQIGNKGDCDWPLWLDGLFAQDINLSHNLGTACIIEDIRLYYFGRIQSPNAIKNSMSQALALNE